MRILLPVHAFTDAPRSGLHTVIWNTAKVLAKTNEVHVIATYVELHQETKESLSQKNIHLHHIAQFNTHNLSKPSALLCFCTALWLRLRMKFDWIYIPDTSRTPFHRFKLGAKLATRVLAPESNDLQELFVSGNWQYDRQRKDAEEGWEGRRKPLWFRLFSVLAGMWFRVFPVSKHTQNADVLFCQNGDTLAELRKKPAQRSVYLPNGVDLEPLEKIEPVPAKTDRFVFLYVGRVAKRYGLFELLPVFAELRKTHDDIELWIVGKGSKELSSQLQEWAQKDPDHVRTFGEIQKEDIGPYYHACSALVNPAFYHGFPSSVLEAMACAKPVLAPVLGGSKDFVTDGIEGYLVDPRKPEELLAKMRYLCEHQKEAQDMGTAGKKKIEKGFLWEDIGRILEDTFRQS